MDLFESKMPSVTLPVRLSRRNPRTLRADRTVRLYIEPLEDRRLLTIVTFNTNMGSFNVELFDEIAPLTVANFLGYVNRGDYSDTIFHRSVTNFVVQAGGFETDFSPIPQQPPVQNEFQVSNTRGTIAMAKLGGQPNSATNQFFFNLRDNSGPPASLDTQNGGFTVFGRVIDDGMTVVDAIAALNRFNLAGPPNNLGNTFTEVPLQNYTSGTIVEPSNLVVVQSITVVPASISGTVFNDADRDGIRDSGEAGIAERTVFLDLDASGDLSEADAFLSTDANGGYTFNDLGAGTFLVRQVVPDGSLPTGPAGNVHEVTVLASQSVADRNFGSRLRLGPDLNPIDDRVLNPGQALQFTATVTLGDSPFADLTFALEPGAPAGATIDADTGVFDFTAPGTPPQDVQVTVRVSDPTGAFDLETFQIRFNHQPVLVFPTLPESVAELEPLSIDFTVTDDAAFATPASVELVGGPIGARIEPGTAPGTFRLVWSPSEGQGPGTFTMMVKATDPGGLFDEVSVEIRVDEVNQAPDLGSVEDLIVFPGEEVVVRLAAVDGDLPANGVTLELLEGPPGATFDPATGLFRWVAPADLASNSFRVTVRAKDDAANPLEDVESFRITVLDTSLLLFLVQGALVQLNSAPAIDQFFAAEDPFDLVPAFTATNTAPDDPAVSPPRVEGGANSSAILDLPDTGVGQNYVPEGETADEGQDSNPADPSHGQPSQPEELPPLDEARQSFFEGEPQWTAGAPVELDWITEREPQGRAPAQDIPWEDVVTELIWTDGEDEGPARREPHSPVARSTDRDRHHAADHTKAPSPGDAKSADARGSRLREAGFGRLQSPEPLPVRS
jgi:cyclophilin family peptidyl-prolyl cis-trans isomerase